ncbi:helix-turn-helix domain-containing protein [Burkholderia sp. LMG 21824]|uniref:helix-turn-helix domain-containing protein n=1 Tax=Burkholderia sp. LMG 21824 TaxID=3158172 RepID=UPI003C2BD5AC
MTELHEVASAMLFDYRAWLAKQADTHRTLANAQKFVDRDPLLSGAAKPRREYIAKALHRESGRIAQPSVVPTPADVRAAREHAGLSQTEAGALVHVNVRSWQKWELGERAMHAAFFELFLIKTGA